MNPKISFNQLAGCLVTLIVGSVGVATATTVMAQHSAEKTSVLIAQSSAAIQGNWRLANMTQPGSPMPMLPSTEQTAEFSAGRISGTGGCNRFNGTYRTPQNQTNQLSIGTLATTFMACEEAVTTQEAAFLAALQAAQRYEVNRDGLQITYRTPQGTGVLRFTSQATTPTPPTPRPTPPPSGRNYQGRGIASGSVFTKGRQTDATLNVANNNFTFGLETPSRLGLRVQYRGTVTRQRSGSSLGRNGFVLEGRIRNFASSVTGMRSVPSIGTCRVEVFDSRVVSSECDTAVYQNSTRFQGLQQF